MASAALSVGPDSLQLVDVDGQFLNQLAYLANNRSIWKNLRDSFPHPYALADAQQWLAFCSGMAAPCPFQFIATERTEALLAQMSDAHRAAALADGDGAMIFIGSIGCTVGRDVHSCTAELGYFLGEPFWGGGLATRAVRMCVDRTFRLFPDVVRIFAEPYADNAASARVLEKAGFTYEGRLRCNAKKDGQYKDSSMYSILRSEHQ